MTISKKTKRKIIAATILVGLALIATFLSTFAMNHYKGPVRLVNRYVESINTKNGKEFVACLPPSFRDNVQGYIEKAGGEQAFFEQTYKSMFEGETPYDSFGENVLISVSNTNAQQQTITDGIYNGLNVGQLEASAVSVVTCDMTTKGSLRETTEEITVTCVKIKGKWYMLNMEAVTPPTPDATPTNVQ